MEIAIVTGANKGIGFEIAEKLCERGDIHVILACRNSELGNGAVSILNSKGLTNCEFRQLDISSFDSISRFVQSIRNDFSENGIDILVNNAAIAFKSSDPTPFTLQASPTLSTNYFGTAELTKHLLPLLRQPRKKRGFASLINVASESGHLNIIKSPELKKKFENISDLTVSELNSLMYQFISDVEGGAHITKGWPSSCYGVSKLGVIALTKCLAWEEEARLSSQSANLSPVLITCCCPGYCDTDMSSHRGTKTAEEGARTPFFLAVQQKYKPEMQGKFFSNQREIEW